MNRMTRYEKVTGNTVVTSFRSNNEYAKYHYFNSNGANAKHRAMMYTLVQIVKDGFINSGWLLSSDEFFHYDNLSRLAMMKRCKIWEVRHHVDALDKATECAYMRMSEVLMGLRDKAGREIRIVENAAKTRRTQ